MKHILFLFSFLICSLASAQIINFPDANFKNALTSTTCVAFEYDFPSAIDADTNNDGEIDLSEAQSVRHLRINGGGIIDLSGIENFTNLLSISFTNNPITSIDLSSNLNLTEIYCVGNSQLTALTLGNNLNLVELNCKSNQLLNLDVSNNSNLETFICRGNQLTTLDVSLNTNLSILDFGNNLIDNIDLSTNVNLRRLELVSLNTLLTSIDLSANTNLVYFSCSSSSITTLDLSNNVNLKTLLFSNTQIPSVNLAQVPLLENLFCANSQISSLDLSNNPNLNNLDVENLQLTQLDVTNNTLLDYLNARNNQISSLDLSQNVALVDLFLDTNNLVSLDLSNNPNIDLFEVTNNPQLTFINAKNGNNIDMTQVSLTLSPGFDNLQAICVDDINSNLWTTYANSPSNPVITEYCSFTPGGDYNTITGNITFDNDTNGCDANDANFPFVRINIDDGTDTGATYTNTDGEYTFYTQDGNFTITPSLENPSFFTVTPIDATINFPNNNNNIQIEDFCITANGIHNDVEIVIAPIFPARPGFDAQYLLTYKNKGNQTLSGNLSFQYDDTVLDLVTSSQTTTSQTVGQLTWDYTNLMPFESRSIYVTLSVNAPTDTPAVNIDDQLVFTATVTPIAGDDLPNDNNFTYTETVIGAYDPNNIICVEGDVVDPSEIGSFLHYVVNFENTGNAPAENVVIEIEIDPMQYDINELYLLSSSHNAQVSIAGNIVKIIFQSIFLASGGHGNILLKIPTQLSLQPQDFVSKTADIFFDYNFPIETNNAETTFATLSNPEFDVDSSIKMYPNPTKDNIYITANNLIKSIEIYDLQGRLLSQEYYHANNINVNISEKAVGVYFVKIKTVKGSSTQKIVKM
ncbi:DUF7619 domain-containing protein [Kordia jejudonensis]|uniref:DUF7619 domain-containing protein n=1 Tax=Kordia jejudonensis TaxID=1348245 RepID=UPI000629A0FE|nr:T9SS type A sorting domain-containing protein [Kordia jejudonensis]